MTQPATIREARVEDAVTLASAERAVASQPGLLASRPEELPDSTMRSTIQRSLGGREGKFVVAEEDGRIVGHAVLNPMGLAATKHIVRLTMVVHPGHEGRGLGKRLLAALLDWARNAPGVRRVELNVRSTNARAIGLYRSLGFIEQGRQPQRIRVDEQTFVDDLEMGLFVK